MDFSLDALGYDALRDLLGRYVSSGRARDVLDAMAPTLDGERLGARLELVGEAMACLRDHVVRFPEVGVFPDVLARLGPGGLTLTVAEIESVRAFAAEVSGLRARRGEDLAGFPLLGREIGALPDLTGLERLLGRAVRAGEIREDYSPDLRRLRRDLEVSRDRLSRKLESLVRASASKGQLQDEIVTVRNGRFVIPVRTDQQRQVQGIVHGTSSSGATVFMEPLETLGMNNDLVRLRESEEREVARILGELSDRIQEHREDLGRAFGLRAGLEALFGIARWAREFDCTIPRFSDDGIWLKGARHPLLEDRIRKGGGRMVPVDLEIPSGERVLVISGPNAGGKTVLLKTLGLFALMAQSGIPVPASDAVLPLADRVLADIGDQQSISNQLSTFSAHVLAVSGMVARATGRSLILLDEIGSSTEPGEGAALGIAVLGHFRSIGAWTVATTHYNRLKMYAETTEGVGNAAMEFDEETLEPTFALIPGLAGQSSGLRIAERLRLAPELLEVARSRLDAGEIEAARFVERLKARIAELEAQRAVFEDERRRFEAWKTETEERIATERRERLASLEKRLDELVADIRRRAEDSLRGLPTATVARFDRTLERSRASARAALGTEAPDGPETPGAGVPKTGPKLPDLAAGARVRVVSLGVEGVVLGLSGSQIEVAVGQMKVQRPRGDLEPVDAPPARLPQNVRFESAARDEAASSELRVIGCTREEALDRLDKFLDDAFLTGYPSVRVIHGSGKGVLREAIRDFLRAHPHVAGFDGAPREQGGAGVTEIRLQG